MASFHVFSQLIDKAEGGYQNSAADKAGNTNSNGEMVGTNHGISAPVYESYLGHPPTQAEMQQMTKDQALHIYQDKYWTMIQGDQLNNQQVANAIGDMAVNAEKPGIQLAHERLWLQGYSIDLPGSNDRLSDSAVTVLNTMNERESLLFVNAYTQDRANYYQSLGDRFDGNKAGWDNRLTTYFPENKDIAGWQDAKVHNYYFTTENIQHILQGDGYGVKADGIPGPGTQAALKEWQATNNLPATGYLDPSTHLVLHQEILQNDTTRQIGDTNRMLGEARDIRHELSQQAKEWSIPFQNMQGVQAAPAASSFTSESAHVNHASQLVNTGYSDHTSGSGNSRESLSPVSPATGSSQSTQPTVGASDSSAI